MDMEKKLYELPELMQIIPMSKSALYKAIAEGIIPSKKIGKRIFVPAWYVRNLTEPPA